MEVGKTDLQDVEVSEVGATGEEDLMTDQVTSSIHVYHFCLHVVHICSTWMMSYIVGSRGASQLGGIF